MKGMISPCLANKQTNSNLLTAMSALPQCCIGSALANESIDGIHKQQKNLCLSITFSLFSLLFDYLGFLVSTNWLGSCLELGRNNLFSSRSALKTQALHRRDTFCILSEEREAKQLVRKGNSNLPHLLQSMLIYSKCKEKHHLCGIGFASQNVMVMKTPEMSENRKDPCIWRKIQRCLLVEKTKKLQAADYILSLYWHFMNSFISDSFWF